MPGLEWWAELDFIFDTGANSTMMYEGDMVEIVGPRRPGSRITAPSINTTRIVGIGGSLICRVVELEMTILDKKKRRLAPWTKTNVALIPGDYDPVNDTPRIDGYAIRSMLICCTVPTQPRTTLTIVPEKHSLIHLPTPPPQDQRYPISTLGPVPPQVGKERTLAADPDNAGRKSSPKAARFVPASYRPRS